MAERKKIRKPSPKQRERGIMVKSSKKRARARTVIKTGKGNVTVNGLDLYRIQPRYARMLIEEPLTMVGPELAKEVDIQVNVHGGGASGQTVSARTGIAKALLHYTGDEKLRDKYLSYDRTLLVDDVRRKEAKKPLGRGARKKKQKSKR